MAGENLILNNNMPVCGWIYALEFVPENAVNHEKQFPQSLTSI